MITLRYHIASLTAMLLTLGLGIWIGTAIGSPGLTSQQKALIKESNVKLDQEVSEREQEDKLLDDNRQALAGLVPHFTHSLLYGKRVAIIQTGDYPAATQDVSVAMADSGAIVESSVAITNEFDDVTDKQLREILGDIDQDSGQLAGDNESTELISMLVSALKDGTTQHPAVEDLLGRMGSNGLITYSGDFPLPVDLVVVVGGLSPVAGEIDSTDEQAREQMVLRQLLAPADFSPTSVVGCEPVAVGTSSIPTYEQAGIASVDCIDEPFGALDLVYALHGEAATYGVKSTATLLGPASLETESGS